MIPSLVGCSSALRRILNFISKKSLYNIAEITRKQAVGQRAEVRASKEEHAPHFNQSRMCGREPRPTQQKRVEVTIKIRYCFVFNTLYLCQVLILSVSQSKVHEATKKKEQQLLLKKMIKLKQNMNSKKKSKGKIKSAYSMFY